MSKRVVVVVGAGGYTRSFLGVIRAIEGLEIDGIYDDSFDAASNEVISGIQVKGRIADIPAELSIVLSVGRIDRRAQLYDRLGDRILKDNFFHPAALAEEDVVLGEANHVFARAYINGGAKVGDNNIINTGAILEHECRAGSHNHISVGTTLCGRSSVGDRCFIGAGAVVIDSVSICSDVTVGAGSTVIGDITEPGTYVGQPARKIS